MTSKYEEEEKIRRRGYVEEDPADSGNLGLKFLNKSYIIFYKINM